MVSDLISPQYLMVLYGHILFHPAMGLETEVYKYYILI